MTAGRTPKNLGASVRDRLLQLARDQGVEFQLILAEFAIERLLYRLGRSRHADRFVLKGANLFKLWSAERGRATWDLDLLGRGPSGVPDVVAVVRELCAIAGDDGVAFGPDTVSGEPIRAADEYEGVRVRLEARVAEARVPVQVDVAFGDAVVPEPLIEGYPTLLTFAGPRVLVYPRETVLAEKAEAVVSLGLTNSRMKDFYDLHQLAERFTFDGPLVTRAVQSTFERRRTPIPTKVPEVLTVEFLTARERQTQWQAFLRRGRLAGPAGTTELAAAPLAFLWPVLEAASTGGKLARKWTPGGPWTSEVRT